MEIRQLGKSAIRVSALGLGCWPLGGGPGWGDQDLADSLEAVHAALDAGITLFDTAEAYNDGHSEEVVGLALRGRRSEAVIATKVSPNNCAPATLRAHCEASLQRLGTDYIDLYQVHWPITDHPLPEAFATLQALQTEGKIRAIGVSNFGIYDLPEMLDTGVQVASNQLNYSLLWRAIEFGILPLCRANAISVLAYMPLMQGLLVGQWTSADQVPEFRARTRHFSGQRPGVRHGEPGVEELTFATIEHIRAIAEQACIAMPTLALAWVMARPGVGSVLMGGRKAYQIVRNAEAARQPLSADLLAALDAASEDLRLALGSNADAFQGAAGTRTRF
jgi:aryl-alcohol dehydrogenase-like predicted oxidoreductase